MQHYRYESKFAKCPFFIAETANAIKCEGIICSQQINLFKSASEKEKHKLYCCNCNYAHCKIYAEANKKYPK